MKGTALSESGARHLLFIGGGLDLPVRARSLRPDLRTSVICRREVLSHLVEPEKIERLIVLRSDAAVEEWVAAARFIHQADPVDRVFNFTDKDTDKTVAIGAALGLPTPAADTYRLIAHKLDMRWRLSQRGVDDTQAQLAESAHDVAAFAERVGFPVICKPVQGVGSRGVTRIDSNADIDAALAWGAEAVKSLDRRELMVEQFHRGVEFSVECLSERGRHVVACITRKISEREHFVELGHVLPAPLGDTDRKRIESVVADMLDALGVTDGVTHTEVIDTGDAVRIVETHLRPAGDEIPYMLEKASGIDLIDALARQSAGLPALDMVIGRLESAEPNRCAAIWYVCPPTAGEIRDIEGLEEARALPGVCEVSVLRGVGEQLTGLSASAARAAYAWAVGSSPQEALERARAAAERLAFTVSVSGLPAVPADLDLGGDVPNGEVAVPKGELRTS